MCFFITTGALKNNFLGKIALTFLISRNTHQKDNKKLESVYIFFQALKWAKLVLSKAKERFKMFGFLFNLHLKCCFCNLSFVLEFTLQRGEQIVCKYTFLWLVITLFLWPNFLPFLSQRASRLLIIKLCNIPKNAQNCCNSAGDTHKCRPRFTTSEREGEEGALTSQLHKIQSLPECRIRTVFSKALTCVKPKFKKWDFGIEVLQRLGATF